MKVSRETDEMDAPIQWAFLVVRTPSPVTVEIQGSRKAKPFVVHVYKVKPYLSATPKSWLAEPNLMDSDEHNDEVIAEHQLSQQEEVRLDSEVIPTTSTPNSMPSTKPLSERDRSERSVLRSIWTTSKQCSCDLVT